MTPQQRALVQATRPQRPPRTLLRDLARATGLGLHGDGATEVTGVSLSSQRILAGDVYAALPGSRVHGIEYATTAVEEGAVAILTDQAGIDRIRPGSPVLGGVPILVADDPRARLGAVAAAVYGDPATAMRTIGVTGTQGKTTTTRLIEGALQHAGRRAGVIGTVGTRVAGRDIKTTLTTPEAPDLHALFAVMRESLVECCAMEVSSHALARGRVDGVVFGVAVFLNLGRDHLDFHLDMEDYYQAKASLFRADHSRRALINIDDEYGRRLAEETAGRGLPVRTFSLDGSLFSRADWRARDIELGPDGSRFTLIGPKTKAEVVCPLPGGFNVSNAVAAVAACVEAGYDVGEIAAGLAQVEGVPGRLERVRPPAGAEAPYAVIVDYAHKPDAVEAAIRALRPLTSGRVIVVIGAGGDRDTGKRPIMGEIAARLADLVVVTDDNPRSEDPAEIRRQVMAGTRGGRAEVLEVGDRQEAIATAMARAQAGDIVLVAGKGHETGQEVAGTVHPFDDRVVVRELFGAVGKNDAS